MNAVSSLSILLADPLAAECRSMEAALVAAGHRVNAVLEIGDALHALRRQTFDVLVIDVDLEGTSPEAILRQVGRDAPDTDVIFIAAAGSVSDAVRAVKAGATDYLARPLDMDLLSHGLGRIAERIDLQKQLAGAQQEVAETVLGPAMVGRSRVMQRMFARIGRVSQSQAPVIVLGESGTGKELVARLIHAQSARSRGPFVAVNCAAFPETLLEAELFGHEKGAFTGATRRRKGRFASANGGTLFLDEVAEIPLVAQAKLLRVLQEGIVEPLGSDTPHTVDVRIISATHRNLRERTKAGAFREDLLFRLRVLEVAIPPLRERAGDLPLLIEHFLNRFRFQDPVPTVSARAWAALLNHAWPGNVRELEHAIQQAVVLGDGERIDLTHLPSEIGGDEDEAGAEAPGFRQLAAASRVFEREYLLRALVATAGKRAETARLLGISRKNLWEKLKTHGITSHEPD